MVDKLRPSGKRFTTALAALALIGGLSACGAEAPAAAGQLPPIYSDSWETIMKYNGETVASNGKDQAGIVHEIGGGFRFSTITQLTIPTGNHSCNHSTPTSPCDLTLKIKPEEETTFQCVEKINKEGEPEAACHFPKGWWINAKPLAWFFSRLLNLNPPQSSSS